MKRRSMLTNSRLSDSCWASNNSSGISGDWKNYFTPEAARVFGDYAGDLLIRLGYEPNKDWIQQVRVTPAGHGARRDFRNCRRSPKRVYPATTPAPGAA